jgi:hypothetical protein
VYVRGNTNSYSAQKILSILGNAHSPNVVCHQSPSRVQINAAFLIDLRVVTLEDLEADDNGAYEHLGTPTHTFVLHFEDGSLKSSKQIADRKVAGENHYFLVRKYKRCSSSPDLKRTISYCYMPSGEILGNMALVQYNFSREEHIFPVKCHGNARKNKEPYYRTKESTRNVMRYHIQNETPKEDVQNLPENWEEF